MVTGTASKINRLQGRVRKHRTAAGGGGSGPSGRSGTTTERPRGNKKTGMLTAGTIPSFSTTERKKKGKKDDGGNEHTFYNSQDGTLMKKNLANVYKILAANSTKNYYEFNAASQLFGARGYKAMYNGATSTTGGVAPVHMVDLTACTNVIKGAATVPPLYYGVLTSGAPASVSTTSGALNVAAVSFQPNGTQNAMFVANSQAAASFAEMYPGEKDRLLWSDIRLQLYGALNVPITWHVYFVQFKKSHLAPNVASTDGTADEIAERAAFWEAMTKPLLFNPILVQDQKHLRDLKIIKHDQFNIAPATSTETLVNPHVKTVKYFERWNKLCNYNWNDMSQVDFSGADGTQASVGENRTTVQHQQRVYMLIACEAFTPGNFSNTVCGSYDIMVKSCHERSL